MSQNLETANIAALTRRIRSLGRLPWVRGSGDISPSQSFLCDTCKSLNLTIDSFIVDPDDKTTAPGVPILGRLSYIRSRNYCPLCRLICEIADRPSDQRTPSVQTVEDPIVKYKWVVDGQDDLGVDPEHPNRHLYRPRTRRLLIFSDDQAFKDGYIVLLADDAPSKEFLGRRVTSSDVLDADMVKEWLRKCEDTHGETCKSSLVHPELLRDVKEVLRAIDVEKMCLVELPLNSRFVALSYLWGKGFVQFFTTSKNLAQLSVEGGLAKEHIPRTIRDSIRLTRMLGEKYLWTDSLCLLHDDGFKYHDDWVYARAALTVVAGSGKDADAGLPGVRKESRVFHQMIEEYRPGMRLMVSHLAEDYISTSQWDSRAWTFQERMLSRRCLLFVNGRIYFQCRRTTFCEDMEPPNDNGWSLDSVDMPTRIFQEPPFVQFTSAVELYTRRELTNPNDILEAFSGIELVLEKRLQTPIFFGVFETRMDSSLLWESNKKLMRRRHFPSWSWSGWIGEVQWKFLEDPQSWIDWHTAIHGERHHFPAQNSPRVKPPIPWHKHPKKVPKQQSENPPPLLHFETITAVFMLTAPRPLRKSAISPLRKRLTGPSALSTVRPAPLDPGLIRAGIADRDGRWCGTIDLDLSWEYKCERPLEFLIMSKVSSFTADEVEDLDHLPDDLEEIVRKPNCGVYNVMLVRNIRGISYREGMGRILCDALHRAMEPGAEWKDILLG